MTPRRKGIGTTSLIIATVLIILIGVVAFVLYSSVSAENPLPRTASLSASTSTSGSSSIITTYSSTPATESNTTVSSSSGLELRVDLNSTAVASDGAVAAQISLFNSLGQNLSLTPSFPANSTIQSWNSYDFLCGENNFLPVLGYALFQGDYSQGNISIAGAPLQLAPPVNAGCVTYPKPTSVVFLPGSDSAVLYSPAWSTGYQEPIAIAATTESCSSSNGTFLCGEGESLSGYWNTTSTISFQQAAIGSPFFRYLQTGEYTLAVQDVWNQTVYAHFQVVSTPSSPVEVVSVTGPIPPYNPGGPVVGITVRNVGGSPLTSLNATLGVQNLENGASGYLYVLANSSSPLMGGQSAQETRTLIGAGFDTGQNYPLTITGTFANGTQFSYTVQVQIEPPSSSSTTATTYTASQSSDSTASTTLSTACTVSAESTGFFLHLIEDATNVSIAGVQVTVTPFSECGPGQGSTESAMAVTYTTNASGWAVISQPPLGGPYYLVYTFQYSGRNYSIDASWEPQRGTFTTVSLPSGQVTTSYEAPVSCNGTCEY